MASACVKMADFALPKSSKMISRKIWVEEKSWNFHNVQRPLLKKLNIKVWVKKTEAAASFSYANFVFGKRFTSFS